MGHKQTREFTGRQMAGVLIVGFGIVAAVNFYMASLATGGFHGIVVENSYVASQKFNTWLDEAEVARKLGWAADAVRDEDGHLVIATSGLPYGAVITADLRRPIGEREYASVDFAPLDEGRYRSTSPVDQGRWTMRLRIEAAGQQWAQESEIR